LYRFDKALLCAQYVFIAVLAIMLLLVAYVSLSWRMEHDTPLLHYAAFLMDRYDLMPYRDIFETSMPGTFAFHYTIGHFFGFGDAVFRYADLTLLAALLAATYVFMQRFGSVVALTAIVMFGLFYLSKGQGLSLQRDYIGIIPVALALLCIPSSVNERVGLARFMIVGALFGLAVLIKPHLSISLPIVFFSLLACRWHAQSRTGMDFLRCALITCLSLAAPIGIALIWLASNNALSEFVNMLYNYLPLHTGLSGSQETLSGIARVKYLLSKTLALGGYGAFLVCALCGCLWAYRKTDSDRFTAISILCLAFCVLAYALYPTFAGKFWRYHYMPLAYFICISAALCFIPLTSHYGAKSTALIKATAALLSVAVITLFLLQLSPIRVVSSVVTSLQPGYVPRAPNRGRVDEIAGWLRANMGPSDTVQSLDWTGGSIHAMLLVEARLATAFMYDYHFYHHISSPVIQELRQRFLGQLEAARPRFIVEVISNKPWVSGADTTREFPALREFLASGYFVACSSDGYLIYEQVSPSTASPNNKSAVPGCS
jgi:hypothetical protein